MAISHISPKHGPWNKGKLVGQKAPLTLRDIWAIRVRLQLSGEVRDLALFNLAIDSKLRACDLVKLHVSDVAHGGHMASRAMVAVSYTHLDVYKRQGHPKREVHLHRRFEGLDLLWRHQFVGDLLDHVRQHHLLVDRQGVALDLDVYRRASGDENIRGLLFGHEQEQLV